MTDSGQWPPEVQRWIDGNDRASAVVLLKLGAMMIQFPTDLRVRQMTHAAAGEYIGTATKDDRGARLEILVDALRLRVSPGSTKQASAEEFLS
jgi:hypothetical protein